MAINGDLLISLYYDIILIVTLQGVNTTLPRPLPSLIVPVVYEGCPKNTTNKGQEALAVKIKK